MVKNLTNSSVQLSLFSDNENGVKDTQNGSSSDSRLSNYLKTREALWRMLASYPKGMPVKDAISRARIDFTKGRKEVVA